jgi:hypothetical protein
MESFTMQLFKYYGTDWLAMCLTFVALYMIGNKQRYGFILMICANGTWLVLGILTSSVALVIANLVFSVMNIRAFVKWSKNDR